MKQRQQAWAAANRDWIREYQRNYRATVGRWKQIEKKYGLSREAHESLLASQKGLCPICRADLATVQVHVDHCHDTGTVRGLLCQRCNQALGLLGDDPAAATRAARYLRR